MNKLIIILDGASDKGKNTPLRLAKILNLNYLAENGKCGMMDVVGKNIAPESDQAMISLLGFDVGKVYTGRGILEALGADIKVKNKIYVRCNFALLNKDGTIKNIEAIPEKKDIDILRREFKNLSVELIPTVGHRAVLVLNTGSPKVTPTHPGYKIIYNNMTTAQPIKDKKLYPLISKPLEKSAAETARIINKVTILSKFLLKDKVILMRGASKHLPILKGLNNFVLIADMPVELAIGKLCKMKVIKKPKSLLELSRIVLKNIKRHNVYLEIKGPDIFGHQGNKSGKIKMLEKIDREFISNIKNLKETVICITADHSTPCSLKAHSSDPVPVLIYGNGKDNCQAFNEVDCRKGILGRFNGKSLLSLLA